MDASPLFLESDDLSCLEGSPVLDRGEGSVLHDFGHFDLSYCRAKDGKGSAAGRRDALPGSEHFEHHSRHNADVTTGTDVGPGRIRRQ